MPRGGGRSSGGRSGSSRSSSYGSNTSRSSSMGAGNRTQQAKQPTPTSTQPPMQQGGGSMLGGIGSTIVTGMAFGGGSEIGHQVVRSMMGGKEQHGEPVQQQPQQQQPMENQQQQPQQKQNPCFGYNTRFIDCLKTNDNSISHCQSLFDDLKSCEKSLI